VEVMLRAISRLSGKQYRFVFAGDGPLANDVRAAAGKDPRIEYLGYLKLSQVLSIYRQADMLINMRLTKAIRTRYFFPSKMMEFLASGTPVLSTCTGHVEEEFGSFVFLLRDESPAGLATAIQQAEAVGPAARARMGRKARAYMLANKTWNVQAWRLASFLRTLAEVPQEGGCR
jgi:glycosyltransferase involved in cell wall biosynthesis